MSKATKPSLFSPGILKELVEREKAMEDGVLVEIEDIAEVEKTLKKRSRQSSTAPASSTP
jgi:hypothetical protein